MIDPIKVAATIEKALSDRTLGEWEFLYINTNVFFRFAVTTERIRTSYDNKLAVRNASANPKQLLSCFEALKMTSFTPTNSHMDVRYAFIVRDKQSREVLTIFMDFNNQFMQINGETYRSKGELNEWFINFARAITRTLQ